MNSDEPQKRAHRQSRAGRGHDKKKEAKTKLLPGDEKKKESKLDMNREVAQKRNAKAFGVNSAVAMRKKFNVAQDRKSNREFIPVVKNQSDEPPPLIVALVGPPKVGKSTLIRSLIKHYTRQKLSCVDGPITVVSGKHRRITLIECPVDLNSMIDIAKVADLVLLMVDASYGFEMEIFEFLHIAKVHGQPRVMGVATHLDCIPPGDKANAVKKKLKHRFWTELYDGATLFCLSRLAKEGGEEYMSQEMSNLARFISVIKTRPIMWRENHPYLLADRIEDMTDPALIDAEKKCDRDVALYGFVRGANLKPSNEVHVPGVGDFTPNEVSLLPDPCPLPKTLTKRRTLNQRERVLYAPLTGYGGLLYDKDSVYIDLEANQVNKEPREGDDMLDTLKLANETKGDDQLRLIQGGTTISRRPVDVGDVEMGEDEDGEAEEDDGESDDDDEMIDGEAASESDADSDVEMESDEDDDAIIAQMEGELEGDMHEKAAAKYRSRASSKLNLKQFVYGDAKRAVEENEQDSVVGGLFVRVMDQMSEQNARDETTAPIRRDMMQRLDGDELAEQIELASESIQDCFVTGDWGDDDATRLLKEDDALDDEELFGDFEDLENDQTTREVSDASDEENEEEEEEEDAAGDEVKDEEKTAKQKAWEKKMKLKAAFDRQYDDKGNPTESYFEQWKKETEEQSAQNKEVFADLTDDVRVGYEGFRAGMYVRVLLKNVPCELVDNFNPRYPLIVGGLLPNEQKRSTVQLRVKRHRWFYRPVLKSRDPLIYSLGWRRFQAMPLYYMQDHNMRQRFLKYSPENMHCWAAMRAPVAPQGTGFLAVQKMDANQQGFRIAATGTVLHQDYTAKVQKKLKLVGYPMKIYKNTAFVKDMFTSQLEATKFEGAQVKTVSGIRGIIKKALKAPEGTVRISFEDRILASDIIICRTWTILPVPDLYLPVTNILQPKEEKHDWLGMKTTGQIRFEQGVKPTQQRDSEYKQINRKKRRFHTLQIPKSLQRELPFKSKPKEDKVRVEGVNKKRKLKVGKAVLLEPKERKVTQLMNILGSAQNEKDEKRKEKARARAAGYIKRRAAQEEAKKRDGKTGKRIHANLLKEIGHK